MTEIFYHKLFDHNLPSKGGKNSSETLADRAPPHTYRFEDDLVPALNISLATGRPLLLRGPSGVGKSSVARAVAWHEGWSYVKMTVTSRIVARDFKYQVDDLRRLQDAYSQRPIDDIQAYLVPGPLFWAFDPGYARSILVDTRRTAAIPEGILDDDKKTVVLIDEIDKADPDVPNDLLDPLGRLAFEDAELPKPVVAPVSRVPLVLLTTNEERDLPGPFLRRCVEHRIEAPGPQRLRLIGEAHFPDLNPLHHDIAVSFEPASPAEYLDAVRACRGLTNGETRPTDLEEIVRAVLGQQPRPLTEAP